MNKNVDILLSVNRIDRQLRKGRRSEERSIIHEKESHDHDDHVVYDRVSDWTSSKFDGNQNPAVLEERGFNVKGMHTKCSPVCPLENNNCCMARLLSKQYDSWIKSPCSKHSSKRLVMSVFFFPKFHCELNPMEMVNLILTLFSLNYNFNI